jgi:predicted AAA+ superfamily ATPase
MDFEEFLWAMGEERLAGYIADYDNDEINAFREGYIEYLKQYFIVGGMPEAVESFRINKDFLAVRNIQNMILSQYEGDFGKHVKANELPRIRMVWNSLPAQLAKENKKFFFGNIKKGARSKDYEIALQWLKDAGLIHIVNKVSKPAVPLKSYMDPTAFKVFMNDIGLLGALSELEPDAYRNSELFVEFKGAMTEQYVLQELVAQESFSLYYFTTEKQTYEVDFLFQKDGNIVPLEVKSGENLKAKSLKFFYEKYMPDVAVRTSLSDMRRQDWLINVPLWAVKSLAVTKKSLINS